MIKTLMSILDGFQKSTLRSLHSLSNSAILVFFCLCSVFVLSFFIIFDKKIEASYLDYPAPYRDCIFGFETEMKLSHYMLVRTVGDACYTDCNNKCRVVFNLNNSTSDFNDTSKNTDYLTYLNRDLIEQCLQTCIMGGVTTFDVRGPVSVDTPGDSPYKPFYVRSAGVPLPQSNCGSKDIANPLSAEYPYIYNSQTVHANQTVYIEIVNNQITTNTNNNNTSGDVLPDVPTSEVYLCGYKTLFIFPDFATTQSCITNGITGCDSTKCVTISDCSGKDPNDPWTKDYPYIGPNNKWYARNASWYDTGLIVRNNDLLNINYYGRYMHGCGFDQTICKPPADDDGISLNENDNLLLIKNPMREGITGWDSCIGGSSNNCTINVEALTGNGVVSLYEVYDGGLTLHRNQFNTGTNPISTLNFDSDAYVAKNGKSDTTTNNAQQALQSGISDDNSRNASARQNIISPSGGLGNINFLNPTSGYPKVDSLISAFLPNAQFEYVPNQHMQSIAVTKAQGPTFVYNKGLYIVNSASGKVSHFSNTSARLGIKHYDSDLPKYWSDNVGGYNVEMTWKGCSFVNGQRLKYALVPSDYIDNNLSSSKNFHDFLSNQSNWKDLVFNDDNKASIIITEGDIQPSKFTKQNNSTNSNNGNDDSQNKAYLVFKINTLQGSTDPDVIKNGWQSQTQCPDAKKYPISNSMCNSEKNYFDSDAVQRSNTIGGYMLNVQVVNTTSDDPKETFLSRVIKKINGQLFTGDPNGQTDAEKEGIARALYEHIITNYHFIPIIRILLVLYIVFTGLVFMIGLAPFTQYEGVVRVLKIAFILILISDSSWDFFSGYFFNLFIYGMRELIVIFTYYLGNSAQDPDLPWMPILGLLYDTINVTWSPLTWNKIGGLLLGSFGSFDQNAIVMLLITGYFIPKMTLMTLFLGIILVIGCIFSTMAILRSILVYLLSLFMLTIMIVIAPLFLSFMLFSVTKEMFNAWVKQFILSTIEPVLTFASVGMFATIYLVVFKAMISYTACSACFLGIDLSIFQICLIHLFYPLFNIHNPDPYYVPLLFLSMVVATAILAHTMYVMVDLTASLCSIIIQLGSASVSNMATFGELAAPIAHPVSAVREIGSDLTGIGDSKRRQEKLEESREESNEIKEKNSKDDDTGGGSDDSGGSGGGGGGGGS